MYRVYVTDALKYISENTAKRVGGVYAGKRFIDFIDDTKKTSSKEQKTEKEVIAHLKSKLRQK